MDVSAAEEAGPDETRRRAEAPRVTPREKSVVDASAPFATVRPMYCTTGWVGHLRSKLRDHLREASGRVHLGHLARAVLKLQPQRALAGSSQTIGGRDELELRIVREPTDKRNESDPSRLSFLPPSVWRRACPDGSSLRRVQTSPSTSPNVELGATFTISVTPWPQSMRSFDIEFPNAAGRRVSSCQACQVKTRLDGTRRPDLKTKSG